MRKSLLILLLLTISFSAFAKEYAQVALRINPSENTLTGMVEFNGERQDFAFDLKKAYYNDGHTFVVYGDWMPKLPEGAGMYMYVFMPDEYMLVTESNRSKKTYSGVRYEFDNPHAGIAIAFSDKWVKETASYKGIDISTYFSIENRSLAPVYFDRLKELFAIYTKKLGDYPYDRFNVVEVPYPAGHALTSMTFISGSIIGMPFLTDVSLGHELVHQWLGVAVEADYEDGNWAEGLTTYFADRLYAEQDKTDREYRKNALLGYMAHARQKEDGTCLMGFHYNKDKQSQAVGYAKSMMVFTMLETILGREDFEKSIRIFIDRYKFKTARWDDIIVTMEDVSGIHLRDFLDGWMAETALADFDIKDLKVIKDVEGYKLHIKVDNKYKWLEYPLEVVVKDKSGKEYKDYLYIKEGGKPDEIHTDDVPVQLIIDPDYKTARMLGEGEFRPSLNHLYSKYAKVIFVNPSEEAKYAGFIKSISEAEVISDDKDPRMYTDKIMIFLGSGNKAFKKMYPLISTDFTGEFMVKGIKSPVGLDRMSYLVIGKDTDVVNRSSARISHYGKYSALVLNGGRSFEKITDESENGIVINITNSKGGVAVQQPLEISDIVKANLDAKAFLIGENHDDYAHHDSQLQFVKELNEAGKDVAVGLEMFQRRFQPVLDAYLKGEISQGDMLLQSEYFSRWRFDFRLYKPIFDYAKEHGIPLIALNLEQEITKKVSAGGIPSLSEDEIGQIPSDIEYTGGMYKSFLHSVFGMHAMGKDFENFYQAQILWDETMADTAANYVKEHPEKTMVILAGNGHVRYGYGIAKRFERRTGIKGVIVVQDEEFDRGIGDYILHPDPIEYVASPKIGVMVEEKDEGLYVAKVSEGSLAERAGVKDGDYITGFDGRKIHNLSDIRVSLLYAQEGREYTLNVKRGDQALNLSTSF
jgi:uncharacterized iron-regulated protein